MLTIQTAMAITKNKNKTNVLIVDDQPDNLRTLAALLTQRGYKVRKAVSGEMAIETAHLDPPSLILLDIRMPQMDGYEVCSALKQSSQTQSVPVIFLSALDDTVDKAKAFAVGGADYITKPFQAEEVLLRVQHQLTIRQQQHQLQQEIQERRYAEELLRLQLKREQLLAMVTNYIRETVQLDEILEKTVQEIRALLRVDRVLICQISSENSSENSLENSSKSGSENYLQVVAESVQSPKFSLLGQTFQVPDIQSDRGDLSQTNAIHIVENLSSANVCKDWIDLLTLFQVKSSAVLPIQQSDRTWGLLMAHNCPNSRIWDAWETEMLQRLTVQLAIAIRQADLYQSAQIQINDLHKLNQLRSDLLDTIFHELRTPIANIKLITRLLMIAMDQTPTLEANCSALETQENKMAYYLKILQDECEHELHLIQDLLDLHHLEAGTQALEPAPIDLKYWVLHIVEPFELRMQQQQQTLCLQLDPALPLINADSFYLSRILTELVNNACKYTPAEQTITIAAHTEDEMLHLSVSNTGIDIPAEECALIFDRFYRIRTCDFWQSGGTGLGLTLVKRLVEYLNGSIQVISGNRQTCFTVKLPLEPFADCLS